MESRHLIIAEFILHARRWPENLIWYFWFQKVFFATCNIQNTHILFCTRHSDLRFLFHFQLASFTIVILSISKSPILWHHHHHYPQWSHIVIEILPFDPFLDQLCHNQDHQRHWSFDTLPLPLPLLTLFQHHRPAPSLLVTDLFIKWNPRIPESSSRSKQQL